MACAWATLICYASMMLISFAWGQKKYFIPYAWKKLLAYIIIVLLLFFVHKSLSALWSNVYYSLGIAVLLTIAYLIFVLRVEKQEFKKIPVLGKYVK